MAARTLTLALGAALALAGCGGPRPAVSDVRVGPAPQPGRYRVEATLANRAGGEGQVEVRVTLVDPATGHTVEAERDVELRGHEAAHFVADIPAPPAAWQPRVQADYPPR